MTVDQSPAEIAVQLEHGLLEYDTTEWNGVLIADAIMTPVPTNDFVAEELDDFVSLVRGSLSRRRYRQRGDGRGRGFTANSSTCHWSRRRR